MDLSLVLTALAVLLSIVAGAAPARAEGVRRSGTILAVDRHAGAITLGEVGPWVVRDGETVITRRTVKITDETAFVRIERMPEAPSGFPGDFTERRVEPWALQPGDFATIETADEGQALVAVRVAVTVVAAR
jgi:hypothetical protein